MSAALDLGFLAACVVLVAFCALRQDCRFLPLSLAIATVGLLGLRLLLVERRGPGGGPPALAAAGAVCAFTLGLGVAAVGFGGPALLSLRQTPAPSALPLARVAGWLGLALLALAAVMREDWLRGLADARPRAASAFVAAGALVFCVYAIGEHLTAQWHAVDDHELMVLLGERGGIDLREAPALLLRAELGHPGQTPRYRPAYWTIRILEAILWGPYPLLWHLSRLGLFAATAALAWWLYMRWTGPAVGTALALYTFVQPVWGDVFLWLGRNECYATPGVLLFGVGLSSFRRRPEGERGVAWGPWAWAAIVGGFVVAVGSKENLLFLFPFALVPALAASERRRLRLAPLVGSLGLAAFAVFMAAAVLAGTRRSGTDVYGHTLAATERLSGVRRHAALLWQASGGLASVCGIGLAIGAAAILDRSESRRRLLAFLGRGALLGIAMGFVYATQLVYYDGHDLLTGSRYDSPAVFVAVLFPAGLALLLAGLLRLLELAPSAQRCFRAGIVAAVALLATSLGLEPTRAYARAHRDRTQEFTAAVRFTAALARAEPSLPVVIQAPCDARTMEHAISLPQFLRAAGVENPMFLRLLAAPSYDRPSGLSPELEKQMEDAMRALARDGGSLNWRQWEIRPWHELRLDRPHLRIRSDNLRIAYVHSIS